MILSAIILGVAISFFYAGVKFYKRMDWQEKPEFSPDLRQMHKKQKELRHIQDLLADAKADGKLSTQIIEEFNRYSENEIQAMESVEKAWLERKSTSHDEETKS